MFYVIPLLRILFHICMTRRKNIILIIASIGIFVEALDIAIINLAVPSIQTHYGLSSDKVQWLQTLYVLLYGGFLIIGGKLSDVIGRKTIFIAGAALFLVTSLGAGLSPSFELLAFFRAIQGMAAALIMPAALSIVTHTFTETRERSKAIAIFSSFAAIGSGSGLSLGGLIATYWGWQWVFFINVPVLMLVLIFAWFALDPDLKKDIKERPDIISGLLLVICLLMLSYGVHEIGHIRENYGRLLALFTGVGLGIYLLKQRLSEHPAPLVNLKLLALPPIITGIGAFLLLGAFFTGFLFLLSLMMQKDMSFSAAKAGLLLVPFSILSAVVAKFILPGLMKKFDVKQTGILGMALMVAGGFLLICSMMSDHYLPLILLSAACVTGLGMTICFTSFSVISVHGIPSEHYGLASSIASTAYFLGGGLGLSLLSLFIQSSPGTNAVTMGPAMVLCLYACVGLVWMLMKQPLAQKQAV